MTDKAAGVFAQRLEVLRDANGIAIAEMARRAGLPRRTMENYFKGHKPGFDALVSMSRGLNVPTDWLCGFSEARGQDQEKFVFEAAFEEFFGELRRISMYTDDGRLPVKAGKAFGVPLQDYATERANEVVRRFSIIAEQYSASSDD